MTVSEVAEKNHSYLDLVKTPQLRKITLVSGFFWYRVTLWKSFWLLLAFNMSVCFHFLLLNLQVCCCFPVLWDQFQDLRLWRQYLPYSIHLWCHWSSCQSPHLLHCGPDWTAKWPGVVSNHNRISDWNKHIHSSRLNYFLPCLCILKVNVTCRLVLFDFINYSEVPDISHTFNLFLIQSTLYFVCASLWWQRVSLRRHSPQHSFIQLNSTQPSLGITPWSLTFSELK